MKSDAELLRQYAADHSDSAFSELVGRYIDLVYSTALRMVHDAALAQDVVQSVFIQLAQKAPAIRDANAVPGWLYRVTRCQAANAVRAEQTRQRYEMEAMMQAQLEVDAAWESIRSGLEDAMASLNPAEQNLVILHFFQNQSWRDVSMALALSEDTVQRRAGRALEKLRTFFAKKGISLSAAVIGTSVAENAIQAAPTGLAVSVTTASLAKAASAGSSGILILLKTLLGNKLAFVLLTTALVTGVSIPIGIAIANSIHQPISIEVLRKGLVLHYTFDIDETTSRVTDTSGSENHGKASGVRWIADGKKSGAYEFNADGDQIDVPNSKLLNPDHLTLSAWIKTSNADNVWRRIFDKSCDKGFALSIAADWNGKPLSGLAGLEIGPGTHLCVTKKLVADGTWHHVVATFDGLEQCLYLDAVPQGKLIWSKPGQVEKNPFTLVIGCNRSNLGEDDLGKSFRGLIDEPMMWNRALSPKEVAFLYASQR